MFSVLTTSEGRSKQDATATPPPQKKKRKNNRIQFTLLVFTMYAYSHIQYRLKEKLVLIKVTNMRLTNLKYCKIYQHSHTKGYIVLLNDL